MTPEQTHERRHAEFTMNGEIYKNLGLYGFKALFIVNGAAIIGLMTFLGNLWSAEGAVQAGTIAAFRWAFVAFICGLCFDFVAILLGWMSALIAVEQTYGLVEGGDEQSSVLKMMRRVRWAAVATVFLSFVSFCAGSFAALYGFPIAK